MNEDEFNKVMHRVDGELASRGMPVLFRPIMAWFRVTGNTTLVNEPPVPSIGPYAGPNLIRSIEAWYKEYFPSQSVFSGEWARRPIVIRGEVFWLRIPMIFNAFGQLNALDYVEGLSNVLASSLREAERIAIQNTFDIFYRQTSQLAKCWTELGDKTGKDLAGSLVDRGMGDLRASWQAFTPHDPTTVLFAAQQGTEKFLKAFIAANSPSMSDQDCKRYGHDVKALVDACIKIDSDFAQIGVHVHLLMYGAAVRYSRVSLSAKDVIERINLSFAICKLVADKLLR